MTDVQEQSSLLQQQQQHLSILIHEPKIWDTIRSRRKELKTRPTDCYTSYSFRGAVQFIKDKAQISSQNLAYVKPALLHDKQHNAEKNSLNVSEFHARNDVN